MGRPAGSHSQPRPPRPPVNPEMLNELKSMGFDEERSRRALKFFRNNISAATDHLLSIEPEMDDLIFGPEIQ